MATVSTPLGLVWNTRLCQMLGYAKEELGVPWAREAACNLGRWQVALLANPMR